MKDKLKTTSFWLGVCGAIVLILESLAGLFGFKISTTLVEEILLSICSVLVLLGIITKKSDKVLDEDVTQDELIQELKQIQTDNKEDIDN